MPLSAITESLQAFAAARARTIQFTGPLTPAQAAFSPVSGVWSIADNLDHLIRTEALYRTQMTRLLQLARDGKATNIDVTLSEVDLSLSFLPRAVMPFLSTPLRLANAFVPPALREAFLRVPLVRARNPALAEPVPNRPLPALRDELASSLAITEALLAGPLPPRVAVVTATHPLLGRNTIDNLLRLMAAHEERHNTQMGAVLRCPAFPRPA